jgi:hypothetical protein
LRRHAAEADQAPRQFERNSTIDEASTNSRRVWPNAREKVGMTVA